MISSAFFAICRDAVPAKSVFVSLYIRTPYYGGPEEGGWWGEDLSLVAHHRCNSEDEAEEVRDRVETLAKQLSDEARQDFGRACLAQCEWLEARGLDSDSLPEVDGEVSYIVMVEDRPGSCAQEGTRHYE